MGKRDREPARAGEVSATPLDHASPCSSPKSLSVNRIPPFLKGGEGGFFQGVPKQIPLFPPFSKGDSQTIDYLRISSKINLRTIRRKGEVKNPVRYSS